MLPATGFEQTKAVACPSCGAVFPHVPAFGPPSALVCSVCRGELERSHGRSLDAALASAVTTLLLLLPANLLPFLTTSVLGVSRQSHLASAATAIWGEGWPWLSLAITMFVVVFPFLRFGLLTLVLGMLRLGHHRPWLGRAFRYANILQIWAMPEVFLLGLWVAYSRLAPTVSVLVGTGAICFIGAGLGSLMTRATLDRAAVWKAIAPEPKADLRATISCEACDLVLPAEQDGCACPRCAATVHARRPNAVGRAAAFAIAALAFYVPANLYPIATLPVGLQPASYTVIQGVKDLIDAQLYGLALLVFSASFLIPFLKLAGIGWCIASVLLRSRRHLVFKTRLFRAVNEIGRWSMLDPFVIACAVPVLQYNQVITGRAEPGATAFAAVVILTMLSTHSFDPRLMWDSKGPSA